MKFFKSTAFLMIVVLAVVAYAYFFEYKGGIQKKQDEDKSKIVITESLDLTTGFTVINPEAKYVFKKDGDTWKMLEPARDVANSAAVLGYLSQFGSEKFLEIVAEGENIDDAIYGLSEKATGTEKPSQISFTLPTKTITVEVGTAAGLQGKRYLRLNHQKKILLASYGWEFQLKKNLNDLREKMLVPQDFKLQSVDIRTNNSNLSFINDSKWVLQNFKTADADQGIVDGLMAQLQATRATKIVDTLRLPKPLLEITAQDTEKKSFKISLYKIEDKEKNTKEYATSTLRDFIFEVPANTIEIFNKTPDEFRDRKRALKLDVMQVAEVIYKSDGLSFHIQKDKDNWVVRDDNDGAVDVPRLNDLLKKVAELRVKTFFGSTVDYQHSGTLILEFKDVMKQTLLKMEWSPKPLHDIFVTKTNLSENLFGILTADIDALPLSNVVKEKINLKKLEIGKPKEKK